ncbi:MAG TPA: hypothetical protein VIM55_08490 [Mucilaginibacter sp.]
MIRYNSLSYSFRIRLATIICAPLLYQVFQYIQTDSYPGGLRQFIGDLLSMSIFLIMLQMAFSVFSWLLLLAVISLSAQIAPNVKTLKWITFMATLIIAAATCLLIAGPHGWFTHDENYPYLMLCNCLCAGISVWMFKLETINDYGFAGN